MQCRPGRRNGGRGDFPSPDVITVGQPGAAFFRYPGNAFSDPVFFTNGGPENGTQRLIFFDRRSASICVNVFVQQQG